MCLWEPRSPSARDRGHPLAWQCGFFWRGDGRDSERVDAGGVVDCDRYRGVEGGGADCDDDGVGYGVPGGSEGARAYDLALAAVVEGRVRCGTPTLLTGRAKNGRKQVPRDARNDNQKSKNKGKAKRKRQTLLESAACLLCVDPGLSRCLRTSFRGTV